MSIFDKLNNKGKGNDSLKETFKFEQLPESLDEFKGLKEASLDNPFKTASMLVPTQFVVVMKVAITMQILSTRLKTSFKHHTSCVWVVNIV